MENWTVGKNKRKKKVKRGFYCNVQFQARLVESSGEGCHILAKLKNLTKNF